jgi:hypothetical protein
MYKPTNCNTLLPPQDNHEELRTCTGNLSSQPFARDVKMVEFSMSVGGREMIKPCELEFTVGESNQPSHTVRVFLSPDRITK